MKHMSLESIWEKRLLSATSVLVLLMSLPIGLDLIAAPAPGEGSQTSSAKTQFPREASGRQPASLLDPSNTPLITNKSTFVHEVACQDSEVMALETNVSFVRIKGSLCQTDLSNYQLVNQSNGYTADLMALGKTQFTSDFVELNEGENQIVLNYRNELGEPRSHTIKVLRRAPASTD